MMMGYSLKGILVFMYVMKALQTCRLVKASCVCQMSIIFNNYKYENYNYSILSNIIELHCIMISQIATLILMLYYMHHREQILNNHHDGCNYTEYC